jgi:hypothetical protein
MLDDMIREIERRELTEAVESWALTRGFFARLLRVAMEGRPLPHYTPGQRHTVDRFIETWNAWVQKEVQPLLNNSLTGKLTPDEAATLGTRLGLGAVVCAYRFGGTYPRVTHFRGALERLEHMGSYDKALSWCGVYLDPYDGTRVYDSPVYKAFRARLLSTIRAFAGPQFDVEE